MVSLLINQSGVRRFGVNFVVLMMVFMIAGCGVYTKTKIKDDSELVPSSAPRAQWLKENHDLIVDKIAKHVRKSHPVTVDTFPRLKLNSIEIDSSFEGEEEIVKKEFAEIFTGVGQKLLPPLSSSETWLMDSKISFLRNDIQIDDTKGAALAGYYGLCFFSGLLIVCPTSVSEFVELNVTILSPQNKIYEYRSLGGVKLTEIGIYKQFGDDASILEIRALSAAIADFADQFVEDINK